MKQFKAEWQNNMYGMRDVHETMYHLLTQHNALCDAVDEKLKHLPNYDLNDPRGWEDKPRTITLPKPEWMKDKVECLTTRHIRQQGYKEALSDASKALGVIIKLEE